MQCAQLLFRGFAVADNRAQTAAVLRISQQSPDAAQEPVRPFHPARAPRFHLLEGAHEHLVESEGIRTVGFDDLVRVNDVATALAHLVSPGIHPDVRILTKDEVVTLLHDIVRIDRHPFQ